MGPSFRPSVVPAPRVCFLRTTVLTRTCCSAGFTSPTELFDREEGSAFQPDKKTDPTLHYPVRQKKKGIHQGIVTKFGNLEFADTLPSETLQLDVSTLIALTLEKSIHRLHLQEILTKRRSIRKSQRFGKI